TLQQGCTGQISADPGYRLSRPGITRRFDVSEGRKSGFRTHYAAAPTNRQRENSHGTVSR
ncbi:MAG: hypothetical protein OER87_19935, partial [Gammaproteobacteria bacterium]|nr:hypothetical protein [Gammaproteobacteria bacterium]